MGTETERLLVLINPQSGVGQALCIFNEMLLPELERVAVSYDLIITEHANHAKLFVVNCEDLRKYTSIITISGDGLIFEVVNGLLQRVDREYCLSQIPLGLVPVGSGNALLSSVFNHLDKLVYVSIRVDCHFSKATMYPVTFVKCILLR
ncbi:unnamed protein product [Toxocara canis]|uniref:DAGKc domain-containing protein n=1 Tax=Toxocara canis TaxID=6265 RepID=A0A183UCJ5_TOXCA|nr:unnamed protein product [Toxocara canis]